MSIEKLPTSKKKMQPLDKMLTGFFARHGLVPRCLGPDDLGKPIARVGPPDPKHPFLPSLIVLDTRYVFNPWSHEPPGHLISLHPDFRIGCDLSSCPHGPVDGLSVSRRFEDDKWIVFPDKGAFLRIRQALIDDPLEVERLEQLLGQLHEKYRLFEDQVPIVPMVVLPRRPPLIEGMDDDDVVGCNLAPFRVPHKTDDGPGQSVLIPFPSKEEIDAFLADLVEIPDGTIEYDRSRMNELD